MSDYKLLPCPFCGGEAVRTEINDSLGRTNPPTRKGERKMKINKIAAPVMGTYEVRDCPNCGSVPCLNVKVSRKELLDAVVYKLSEEVYCTCCGLSGVSVRDWNQLSRQKGE